MSSRPQQTPVRNFRWRLSRWLRRRAAGLGNRIPLQRWKDSVVVRLAPRRPVILLMRYSVLQKRSGGEGWELRRSSGYDEYRAELLADDRLSERLVLLRQVVLPSLAAQTASLDPRYFRLIVFTSAELPEPHLSDLRGALARYPWASIELVGSDEKPDYDGAVLRCLASARTAPGAVATARLDDDDALCRTYLQRMAKLVTSANAGKIVTFSYGFLGRFDPKKRRFTKFFRILTPFTAIGLALISRYDGKALLDGNIFMDARSHLHLLQHPHIEDMSFPAFVRSFYETQDTSGKATHVLPQPGNKTTRDFVLQHVALDA